MTPWTGLVLAGTRGEGDPLAALGGVAHRALLPVAGVPMLLRVVRTLRATPGVGPIATSIDDPAALDAVPELAAWVRAGELTVQRSRSSPSRSVLALLETLPAEARALVTTADHALLTPELAGHFLAAADERGADLVVGVVSRDTIEARFPDTRRTYLRMREGDYSGANLFAFRTPAARRAAAFWVRAESHRKRPWRLASSFGVISLLLFALRRLDLDAALERASRSIGAEVAAVSLPFAEAAVDVDRPSDLELAERILAQSTRSPAAVKEPAAGS